MTDPTVNPVSGSRFDRAWRRVRNWARGESPTADQKLEQVRAKTPAPVLWLYGKTQSGKTSVVRFLTGATDAEIGNGFRPCTRHSRQYPFPTEDAPVFTFLDTRGVDEPGYDPAEEIAAFDAQAHLLIVTCRVTDFATGRLRETLKTVRDANPRRPVLLVLTCLHEAYPQQQHPQPYPFSGDLTPRLPLQSGEGEKNQDPLSPPLRVGEGAGGWGSSEVPRLLSLQREHFAGLVDRVIPVDLTRPEEGFDDPNYGGEALKQAILELLPTAFRETLRHLTDAQQQFRDRHERRAAPVLVGYSSLAATAGALPIPFVDLLTIPAVQARMVKALADLSGDKESGTRFLELSASAGVGLLAAVGARQLVKLIPYVGSVVGAGLAGASTYALGRAFLEYDRRVNDGHLPDKAEVARLYREHLTAAERSWGKK
jgi:uncharacterized protein (DUF697 family)